MDAVIPTDLADKWDVRNYLSGPDKKVVRCARLRGEMSYGIIMPNEGNWEEGKDVSEYYGIVKYVAPVRSTAADTAPMDILFPTFTDVENINNFPDAFVDGEEVVVTEKIDGCNDRVGFSISRDGKVEIKAGSMSYKRTMPALWDLPSNPYWYPWTLQPVINMMKLYHDILKKEFNDSEIDVRNVTLFGEVYGGSIIGGHKSMDYGTPGAYGFGAYGLRIDNNFIDWESLESICGRFQVPLAPVIAKTTFNMRTLRDMATGDSLLAQRNNKKQIREGVVVYPVKERRDPKLGRCILKVLNPDYPLLKNRGAGKGEIVDFKDE